MVTQINPREYITQFSHLPTVDVRSPQEYAHAHIPGALSIPLFSDQERAIVGTLYKQQGREAAVRAGLEIIAPHMISFIDQLRSFTEKKELVVHCWRGGMRSHAVAMLFSFAGYKTYQIIGGYKGVKQELRHYITTTNFRPILIGGHTGSGKTKLLAELEKQGEQVINLEDIAHHRGSTYGNLGQHAQPTQEQFNLRLFWQLYQCDPQKTLWLEHEGRRIGSLHVPQEIISKLEKAPVVCIKIPEKERMNRILEEYGSFAKDELIASTKQLEQRLGNQKMQEVCCNIQEDNLTAAVEKLLQHYDAAYNFATQRNTSNTFIDLDFTKEESIQERAKKIVFFAQRL